ncbi:MAG: hypothetical protein DRI89_10985 [Bacteroidetes bacterium]|nr:MAG: hypothetical protein DRI89_10985 [Bacteroidota bacterium]
MFWSTRPFVRILLYLVTGILLGYYLPVSTLVASSLLIIGLISLVLLYVVKLIRNRRVHKWQWMQGLLIGFTLALTGLLLITLRMNTSSKVAVGETKSYWAEVVNDPIETQLSVKMLLSVRPIKVEGDLADPVQLIAFLAKDMKSQALKYGDRFLFQAKIGVPNEPMNPGEFNYKKYLALNGIHYSVFINGNQWQYIDNSSQNIFKKLAGQLRNYLLQSLQENGLGGRDYAVAAAILLGYDNLMDTDLEQDFVNAGAMHILCVSGLHVGVIFLVFNLLLGFLRRNRFQRIIKALLLLLLVWSYAMLTGLSPSVQRAAVMISIFIFGNALERRGNAFNTLAASAFLLLLFNPLLIFNVGFQLSYSAVLGILTFHRPIYLLMYFKNKMADKIWSITVLSFAAQLGTFPLAAHYFHFFPTYFWLTNLFVFPLSFLIIAAGMLFIAVSWLPLLPMLIGTVLSGFIYLLNQLVGFVKYLPFHGMNDLYFPWFKVLFVYAIILLLFFMFSMKKVRLLLPVLGIFVLLLTFQSIHKYNILKQNRMVVYSIKKHSAYDFINGREHLLLLDSVLIKEQENLDYSLTNSRVMWGLDHQQALLDVPNTSNNAGLYFDVDFAAFGDLKIAIVDGSEKYYAGKFEKMKLDVVFVKGKKSLQIKKLQTLFNVNEVILDASVPIWKSRKIEREVKENGFSCYNVRKKGAYIVELQDIK